MSRRSVKCDMCKHIATCSCPSCERAICWEQQIHIHELGDKEILECVFYEERLEEEE